MTTTDATDTKNVLEEISLEQIANYLLNNSFLLTSLEFHEELLERGMELPSLKTFFTNENLLKKLEDVKTPLAFESPERNSNTSESISTPKPSVVTKEISSQEELESRIVLLEYELRQERHHTDSST